MAVARTISSSVCAKQSHFARPRADHNWHYLYWPFHLVHMQRTYSSEYLPRISVCLIIAATPQYWTWKLHFSKFVDTLCSEALEQPPWLPREASRKPGLYPEACSSRSQIGTELSDLALRPAAHHLISRAVIHFHLWDLSWLLGKGLFPPSRVSPVMLPRTNNLLAHVSPRGQIWFGILRNFDIFKEVWSTHWHQ